MTTDEEIFKRWKENQGGAWECPELIECNILECMKLAREDVLANKGYCCDSDKIAAEQMDEIERLKVAKTKLENALMEIGALPERGYQHHWYCSKIAKKALQEVEK